ncbi:MAG: hypothetical protein CL470_01560 [Acidimicrobiaceae bacterium]|nr:hypothetical protein [Acidimicrobiaceae bacterium]
MLYMILKRKGLLIKEHQGHVVKIIIKYQYMLKGKVLIIVEHTIKKINMKFISGDIQKKVKLNQFIVVEHVVNSRINITIMIKYSPLIIIKYV